MRALCMCDRLICLYYTQIQKVFSLYHMFVTFLCCVSPHLFHVAFFYQIAL